MDAAHETQRESRGEKRKKSESVQENGKNSKPGRNNNGSETDIISNNSRPWADFPLELLYIISNNLSIEEFLRVSRVCRSWRLLFFRNQTLVYYFTVTYYPLFSYPLKNLDEKPSRFYEITGPLTYKTRLPDLYGYNCLDISSGYLKRECFWLINLITVTLLIIISSV